MSEKRDEHAKALEDQLAEIQKATESRVAESKARVDAKVIEVLEDADDDDTTTGVQNLREMAAREGLTLPPLQGSPHDTQPSMRAVRPDDESGPATERPKLDAHTPRSEHVLVVDDEPDIRDTLADILREEGYAVRSASDGVEALHKILKTSAAPDCVLLDLGMPHLDGRGVIAALQTTEFADLPVVIITAGDLSQLPGELRTEFVFAKPLNVDHLLTVVRARVAEWRQRRGRRDPRRGREGVSQ